MERAFEPPAPLRLLSADQLEAASLTNAKAYMGYPLMDALFSKYRERHLERMWKASVATYGDNIICLTEGPQVESVSYWLRPGAGSSKTVPFLANGGFGLSPATWIKLMRYESYAEKMMKRHANSGTWYLFDLAVRPSAQGRGLGGTHLRPMLKLIEDAGQSCWLETHDPKNVPLYEHFGFCLMETGIVPGSEIVHFGMMLQGQPRA